MSVRYRIKKRIIILLILVLGAISGDLFNLPLWPVDYLRPRIPVEIKCHLAGLETTIATELIRNGGGIEVVLAPARGGSTTTLLSDPLGIIRTVVPIGRFKATAQLAAVYQGYHYVFSTKQRGDRNQDVPGAESIAFSNSIQVQEITLSENVHVSSETITANFKRYLMAGDWASAQILAEKLGDSERQDIDTLQSLYAEIEQLPIAAYNSRIEKLGRIIEIAGRYLPDPDKLMVRNDSGAVWVNSHRTAIRASRNAVISADLRMMQSFLEQNNAKATLEIWMQYEKNPELNPGNSEDYALLPTGLHAMQLQIPEIRLMVEKDLTAVYDDAVARFEGGDFDTSRKLFAEVLTWLRNIDLIEEFKDMSLDTRSYLDDIALMSLSNEMIRSGRYQEALDSLDLVLNVTDLVSNQIAEIRELALVNRNTLSGGSED